MTTPEPSQDVLDPPLRAELLTRAERDQQARLADTAPADGDWSAIHAVDADNLVFLAPLIERFGWLGSDRVGEDGAHACWLLVQHAPSERRDAWLPLMRDAVEQGLAAERDLAYLQDRVDMNQNRPQTFGTQSMGLGIEEARLWPVTDPATLNERRRALDLPPLDAPTLARAWTPAELAERGRSFTS